MKIALALLLTLAVMTSATAGTRCRTTKSGSDHTPLANARRCQKVNVVPQP